jgi:4-carboxymuconolactone decarboxylase
VGPLAAAMHRLDLAEKWSDLGLVLRFNSSFPPRLREFVILLTGRHWDCQSDCQFDHPQNISVLSIH